MSFFIENRLINHRKVVLVPGSGIDLDYFSSDKVEEKKIISIQNELNINKNEKIVLCVSRMLYDKGIAEFANSAELISKNRGDIRFIIVGPLAPGNPSMISNEVILSWVNKGYVEYLGRRDDIRELMFISEVVVLPTYYKEGIPRVLLEAAAMGKAIITTDVQGCRDVVTDGENGSIVPVKNKKALALAIQKLIDDEELRRLMGKKSRERAIKEFSEEIVIAKSIQVYQRIMSR